MNSEIPNALEAQDDPEMADFKKKLGPVSEMMTPKMLEEALLLASVPRSRSNVSDTLDDETEKV